ncbi:MAG TPA: phosphatase PAP2 family protein [Jiangellaceae bacterium]|nr:phosphatase PAP2 family protein [Jiangellaceae bacterium]
MTTRLSDRPGQYAGPSGVSDRRPRRVPMLVREAVLIAAAAALYTLVRGLANDRAEAAFEHAEQIISFERWVGLFVEPALQQAIIGNDLVVTAANAVYIAFWPVIVITLVWVLLRRPAAYPRFRNAILASGALSLVLFAFYPLAPPRFMPQYGFVDTITQHATSYRTLNTPALVNEYAAMPSLHFGWILLVGIAWITLARRASIRALGVALPALMFASIVLTANHYIVDGIVAGVVIMLGLGIAAVIDRWSWSRYDGEPAPLQRPQHLEMAPVQGGDPPRPVPSGENDVRGVRESNAQFAVALHDVSGPQDVHRVESRQLPRTTAELPEHGQLGARAEPGADEMVQLGKHER